MRYRYTFALLRFTAMTTKYQLSIAVRTQFVPEQSDPNASRFVFAYTITITNTGSVATQVVARHWVIEDANGRIEQVKGLGVVGQQPLLKPGEKFEYTSGCPLPTPSGSMKGHYLCVAEDAHPFDAPIAEFALALQRTLH
jgi:ApaG protein